MTARKPKAILTLDDFDEPKNLLVYGDAGVGKTPFGASCPRSLMLTTESGTISARRLGQQSDVWPCKDDWEEFVRAYRWLHDNPDHGYEWLVIDNATQAQEIMLRHIVAVARQNNQHRDEDIPAIQDYQKWYLMFDRFVKLINNLPVNTLWLAHSMRKTDQDGEEILMPAIQGQDYAQASKFCGRMQGIGYMEYRTIKRGDETVYQRRILWRKTQHVFAKDRYIFEKDVADRYTIAAEGDVERTSMAVISRRIDAALAQPTITSRRSTTKKATASKKVAAKKPVARAKRARKS